MRKNFTGKLFIGTSNILVPGTKAQFPESFRNKSRLQYYSSLFNSVELNTTFYKIPMGSTFARWAEEVNPGFRFTIKLWKMLTHGKDMSFDKSDIDKFLSAAHHMGEKKGCILVQFPGKISLDHFNRIEDLMEHLYSSEFFRGWRIATEFRNNSWYVGETFELLNQYCASLVLHDITKGKNIVPLENCGFIYLRFHGPKGDYRGSYSEEFLNERAKAIQSWLLEGKEVYAYFNNSIGEAFENSQYLRKLLQQSIK